MMAMLPMNTAGADVWMLVGSDSREGIDPDRPDAAAIIGEPVYGQRADTIILVRDMPGTGPQMLSLPRDLWFDPADNMALVYSMLGLGFWTNLAISASAGVGLVATGCPTFRSRGRSSWLSE